MKTTLFTSLAAAVALAALAPRAGAHCQIPCGIYNDNNVIEALHTDWVTIEKATKTIPDLAKDPTANANQLARWIANKESHAQNIQDVVARYFLAQRVKLPAADGDQKAYQAKLTLCHKIIVTAMKCKQSIDPKAVATLHDLLHEFEDTFGTK